MPRKCVIQVSCEGARTSNLPDTAVAGYHQTSVFLSPRRPQLNRVTMSSDFPVVNRRVALLFLPFAAIVAVQWRRKFFWGAGGPGGGGHRRTRGDRGYFSTSSSFQPAGSEGIPTEKIRTGKDVTIVGGRRARQGEARRKHGRLDRGTAHSPFPQRRRGRAGLCLAGESFHPLLAPFSCLCVILSRISCAICCL